MCQYDPVIGSSIHVLLLTSSIFRLKIQNEICFTEQRGARNGDGNKKKEGMGTHIGTVVRTGTGMGMAPDIGAGKGEIGMGKRVRMASGMATRMARGTGLEMGTGMGTEMGTKTRMVMEIGICRRSGFRNRNRNDAEKGNRDADWNGNRNENKRGIWSRYGKRNRNRKSYGNGDVK